MELLYIKMVGIYSINSKRVLVKYNVCYDNIISYIQSPCFTIYFLEDSRFCEIVLIFIEQHAFFVLFCLNLTPVTKNAKGGQ